MPPERQPVDDLLMEWMNSQVRREQDIAQAILKLSNAVFHKGGLPLEQSFLTLDQEDSLPGHRKAEAGTNITFREDPGGKTLTISATSVGGEGGCSENEGAIIGCYIGVAAGSGYLAPSTVAQLTSLNSVRFPVGGCLRNITVYNDGTVPQGGWWRFWFLVGSIHAETETGSDGVRASAPLIVYPGQTIGGIFDTTIPAIRVAKYQAPDFKYQSLAGAATLPRINGISAEFVPDIDCSLLIASGTGGGFGLNTVGINSIYYVASCSGNGFGGLPTTENRKVIVLPFPGTLKRFSFSTSSAQPGDGTMVGTIRKNGAASALTQTVPVLGGGGSSHIWNDEVNEVACVAGDYYTTQFDNNSPAAVSARIDSTIVLYESATTHKGWRVIAGHTESGAAFGAGTTNYSTPMVLSYSTTDANQRWPFPRPGILSKFYAFIETAGTGLVLTVMVYDETGTLVDSTITGAANSSGVVEVDLAHTFAVLRGYSMNVKMVQTGAGGPVMTSWSLGLAPAA